MKLNSDIYNIKIFWKAFLIITILLSATFIFLIYTSQKGEITVSFKSGVDLFEKEVDLFENEFDNASLESNKRNASLESNITKYFINQYIKNNPNFRNYETNKNKIIYKKIKIHNIEKFYLSLETYLDTFINNNDFHEILKDTNDELIKFEDLELKSEINNIKKKIIIKKYNLQTKEKYILQFLYDQLSRSKNSTFNHMANESFTDYNIEEIYQNELIFLMGSEFIQKLIDLVNSGRYLEPYEEELELKLLQNYLACNSYCQIKPLLDDYSYILDIEYNIKLTKKPMDQIYLFMSFLIAIMLSLIFSFVTINSYAQVKKLNT